jgi:CDGSH-type Zn-finger protein
MSEAPIKIKLIPNGPVRILEGTVEIILADGSSMTKEAPFSLCRCGQSQTKPFCDGTHKTCGFVAE